MFLSMQRQRVPSLSWDHDDEMNCRYCKRTVLCFVAVNLFTTETEMLESICRWRVVSERQLVTGQRHIHGKVLYCEPRIVIKFMLFKWGHYNTVKE